MAKFTDSKWTVEEGPFPSFVTINCGKAMKLPVCFFATDLTPEEGGERIANAHLIASAPDMYKALINIQIEGGLSVARHKRIDELLKKARGE